MGKLSLLTVQLVNFRMDFRQNPPLLPSGRIPPRRNLGVVQQRAVPIVLLTQLSAHQQPSNVSQPLVPAMPLQQVAQPQVP